MRARAVVALVVAVVTVCLVAPSASAAGTSAAGSITERVQVRVGNVGTLSYGGQMVTFGVSVRCAPGLEVLEALVTVSQDNVGFVEVFFPLSCTGRWQRFVLIGTVLPEEPPFVPGRAQASAFVLAEDPQTLDTYQAQDTRRMRLVG